MRPLLLVAPLLLAAGCNRTPPKPPAPNPAEVDVSTPVVRDSVCRRTLTELFRSLIRRTLEEVGSTFSTCPTSP